MMSKILGWGSTWALGLVLILSSTGCGSSTAMRTNSSTYKRAISPNLVLPGDELSYAQRQDWQFSRNDQRLSVGREIPSTHVDEVEIRTNDRIRIDDGRPHNHSTTRIRSIRRHKRP